MSHSSQVKASFKKQVIWGAVAIIAFLSIVIAIPGELELAEFRKQSEDFSGNAWVLERRHRVGSTSRAGDVIHSTSLLVLGDAEVQAGVEKELRARLLPDTELICSPTYSADINSERIGYPPHDIRHYYIYRLRTIEWYDWGQWLSS